MASQRRVLLLLDRSKRSPAPACHRACIFQGILVGDDWNWGTVSDAVRKFAVASADRIDAPFVQKFESLLPQEHLTRHLDKLDPPNVVRYKAQWALAKR